MRLIVQPEHGAAPLIEGIDAAAERIEIAIFRFDHAEIKRALERAVSRGVSVHALIANTNRGSEKDLRRLEMDLLAAGIEVSRTASDLVRHHYKFIIIDRKILYLLTFNFTHLDMESSRSFGIVANDPELAREASRLFHADAKRQPFRPAVRELIVSPVNARVELARFIKDAQRQLLIYDPEVSDQTMVRLLRDRANSGVEIRVVGHVSKPRAGIGVGHLPRDRFHTRVIIRDGRDAFLGSQSLREVELDKRRELGLIVSEKSVVRSLVDVFERDWSAVVLTRKASAEARQRLRQTKGLGRRIARAVADAIDSVIRQIGASRKAADRGIE